MTEILPVSKLFFKRQVIGLSFEVCNSFLPQLASKLQAVESGSPNKVPGKGAFYYINHHNSGTFSGLPDSTARNFEASQSRKELYTGWAQKNGPRNFAF